MRPPGRRAGGARAAAIAAAVLALIAAAASADERAAPSRAAVDGWCPRPTTDDEWTSSSDVARDEAHPRPPAAAAADEWLEVARADGVVVSEREVAGRNVPTFRGVTEVPADVGTVLDVLQDVARYPEWMQDCAEARVLGRRSDGVSWVYNRTDVPWPAADRDVVLRSRVDVVAPGRVVYQRFVSEAVPLMPEVAGVVRIHRLQGYYRLEAIGATRTRVEYVVDADPGGILPAWIARRATRGLPLTTLRNLGTQLERVRAETALRRVAGTDAD
jgi:START domain